jgi:transcriptional regulator with XRE-family HTH domain
VVQDIPAPPEAEVIKLTRMAARLTVAQAAAKLGAAGGTISETYWRDVERGHGGRRGLRVAARASDGLLAQMAEAVGVTPDQLREAARDHPDGETRAQVVRKAARVLEEILRRRQPAAPLSDGNSADPAGGPGAVVIPFPANVAEVVLGQLAAIEDALGSPVNTHDRVEVVIAAQHKSPERIALELRKWRGGQVQDPAAGDRDAAGGR